MERNLSQLGGKQYDVLIIGGGIYGVYAAWDAASRGLSVALIDKADFGAATSSNSLKIIHGGLRYLQHADFKRMRESIAERRILMRIAPHLVHPLPCIMPTYGHAMKGKEVMAVALFMNDLVGFDRNGLADPQKHLPRGRVISKKECLKIIPGIDEEGLTGGAIWYDCQVNNSERMLLSILHSAVKADAVVANYVEMLSFMRDKERVSGVVAKDHITGEQVEIRAKLVINNSGPWVENILSHLNGHSIQPEIKMSAAMNLVLKRQIISEYAAGIWSKATFKDTDALISKGSRLFFITPWQNYSIIGTTHVHYEGDPGQFKIREQDIQSFVNEVNEAYPAANIKREDVSFFYGGLLPADANQPDTGDVKLLKSYRIIDHEIESGIKGLLSVVSVKYTTARDVAQKTVDYIFNKLNIQSPACQTSSVPLFGGEIELFDDFLKKEKAKAMKGLSEDIIEHLIKNYGSEYKRILNYTDENSDWAETVNDSSNVLKAEIIHTVREEMALKLRDVVRIRTELGSAAYPGLETLETCAALMAHELGWDAKKIQSEIDEAKAIYVPA